MSGSVFSGWTEKQTIYVPFKEGETPSDWWSGWSAGCSANIVYAQ